MSHKHTKPMDVFWEVLASSRADLSVAIIYAVGVGLLTLAVPVAVQALVGTVAFGALMQPIVVLTVLFFAVLCLAGILRALQTVVIEWIERRVFARVAIVAEQRLSGSSLEAVGQRHGPELVNRFFDVMTFQKSIALLLGDGLGLVLQLIVGLLLLSVYHPILLAFGVCLIVLVALIWWGLGKHAVTTSIAESAEKYAVAAHLEDIARPLALLRSARVRRWSSTIVERRVLRYLDRRADHFRIFYRQVVASLALQAVASALLLGVGGWLVVKRQLTLGQLVASELVVTIVVTAIAKMGKYLEVTYDLLTAADKVGYIVHFSPEPTGTIAVPVAEPMSIELVDVEYQMPDGARPVFSAVSASVAPGRPLIIEGGIGSGKSTLLDLIAALRLPTKGAVQVARLDTRSVDVAQYRDQIAVVRVGEVLGATIEENLTMGSDVPKQVLIAALREVGLWGSIEGRGALEMAVSPDGRPLSPSQGLLLAFARAIVQGPRVILLEDLETLGADACDRIAACLSQREWIVVIATRERGLWQSRLVGATTLRLGSREEVAHA